MDHRETAKHYHFFESIDERNMTGLVYLDDEITIVKMKYDVCPTCNGQGSHVNPSIDSQGISPEEFEADPDFRESYFRGDYNVQCYECGGKRVIPVADPKRNPPEILKAILKAERAASQAAHERAREIEMGY